MSNLINIDSQDLISSKENIQPLRRGRDTSILSAALQAETDIEAQQELERQRNEFEIRLRSNNSEDPLSDWCSYIHWIEQSFPKQGKHNLNLVLRKCIRKFKDNKKYVNDPRFVKLCIKYADLGDNTTEFLGQINRHGIGETCAELYIAWAEKYVVDNCFRKANKIYEKGLQCGAQPLELLQEAHKNFQAFLACKMLNEGEIFQPTQIDQNLEEIRQPYNKLKSISVGQKEVVPNIRIGVNVAGTAGKFSKTYKIEEKPKSNTLVKVFEDSENIFSVAEPKTIIEKLPSKKSLTKENNIKPGTWNNKKNKHVPFTVDKHVVLPFQVHRDEINESLERTPKIVPSSVLKPHKEDTYYEDENFANAPVFYPEPHDPMKVSMYCKELVYAGGIEFQFEELRAIQYIKRQKDVKSEVVSKSQKVNSFFVLTSQLNQSPIDKENNYPANFGNENKKLKSNSQNNNKNNFKEVERKGFIKKSSEEENLINTDCSLNQTINTKEALKEMEQLWFSKPASPVNVTPQPIKMAGKSILKSSKPSFNFYVDESCLGFFKTCEAEVLDLSKKSENISEKQNNMEKLKQTAASTARPAEKNLNYFGGVRRKTIIPNQSQFLIDNKENCYLKDDFEPLKAIIPVSLQNDENKENVIPFDYCGPVGKTNRQVSGILTPAENIEIAALSDEEVITDGEEQETSPQDFSSIIQCNTTAITETWNFTKGFQFPRGESTPNLRQSCFKKESVDESSFVAEAKNIREQYEKHYLVAENNDKPLIAKTNDKKTGSGEVENLGKNLSVIIETSREYRSSSSGSSGVSTLPLRQSKNFLHTSCDFKSVKLNLTPCQSTIQKLRAQNHTGYEASSESSQTVWKTPVSSNDNIFNTTFDLVTKLNAINSISVTTHNDEEVETETIDTNVNKPNLEEKKVVIGDCEIKTIDPFSQEITDKLLLEIQFPNSNHTDGYFLLHDKDVPIPKVGSSISLGVFNFSVKKLLGEGAYAKVFKLFNTNTNEYMICKYQKPSLPWEFYITREVHSRIRNVDLIPMFINIEEAYFFKNCSLFLMRPVEFGNLLSVINKMKQGNMMCEILAIYFVCQILKILETLHSCKIIHGDIKPDNFLLRKYNNQLQLQVIDFGRSIDMSLFPEDITFNKVVTTDKFTTVEMKLKKPWTYQIDLYGAANCGHCLLFGDYMTVNQKNGIWNITKTIPRYWAKSEWKDFFTSLLNVKSCDKQPDLSQLRKSFEVILKDSSDFEFSLFKLNNLLLDR